MPPSSAVGRKREREEQDECTSPGASPQQPKARQGECRGRETGQQPLENGLPQEKATQRAEREREEEETEGRDRNRREDGDREEDTGQTEGETVGKGSEKSEGG